MRSAEELGDRLEEIDGRGYKAYKSLAGGYRFPGFELFIDHVQGDPFAEPSKLRLRAPQSRARIPGRLFDNRVDPSQTRAIGYALHHAARHLLGRGTPVAELLDHLEATLDESGLAVLSERACPEAHPGRLARPRRFEIAAAPNRLRSVKMERLEPT